MKSKYDNTDYRSTTGHKSEPVIDKEKAKNVLKGAGVTAGVATAAVAVAAGVVNAIAAYVLDRFNKK